MQQSDRQLEELITIIKTLRSENGCPWDKKQTAQTLTKYIKEEVAELLEGIEMGDVQNICEESGDVLFLILMLAEIHTELNEFTLNDIISTVSEKLIRRHPHVFSDTEVKNEEELKKQWEAIKRQEKANR